MRLERLEVPLDVLSLVALEVEVAVEVEPALAQVEEQVLVAVELLVALVSVEEQVALEAEKFPAVCGCAVDPLLEVYQDSSFRDLHVQNLRNRVHLLRDLLYHDRSP